MILVLHGDEATERLAFEHKIERLVDLRERDSVRDEFLQLQIHFLKYGYYESTNN